MTIFGLDAPLIHNASHFDCNYTHLCGPLKENRFEDCTGLAPRSARALDGNERQRPPSRPRCLASIAIHLLESGPGTRCCRHTGALPMA